LVQRTFSSVCSCRRLPAAGISLHRGRIGALRLARIHRHKSYSSSRGTGYFYRRFTRILRTRGTTVRYRVEHCNFFRTKSPFMATKAQRETAFVAFLACFSKEIALAGEITIWVLRRTPLSRNSAARGCFRLEVGEPHLPELPDSFGSICCDGQFTFRFFTCSQSIGPDLGDTSYRSLSAPPIQIIFLRSPRRAQILVLLGVNCLSCSYNSQCRPRFSESELSMHDVINSATIKHNNHVTHIVAERLFSTGAPGLYP